MSIKTLFDGSIDGSISSRIVKCSFWSSFILPLPTTCVVFVHSSKSPSRQSLNCVDDEEKKKKKKKKKGKRLITPLYSLPAPSSSLSNNKLVFQLLFLVDVKDKKRIWKWPAPLPFSLPTAAATTVQSTGGCCIISDSSSPAAASAASVASIPLFCYRLLSSSSLSFDFRFLKNRNKKREKY